MITDHLIPNQSGIDDLDVEGNFDGNSFDNSNNSCKDSFCNKTATDDYLNVFPRMVTILQYIFTSKKRSFILKFCYGICSLTLFFLRVLFPIFVENKALDHYEYEGASTAFMIFFYIHFMIYLLIPFYYIPLLQYFCNSRDYNNLLREAVAITSWKYLHAKFGAIYFINLSVTLTCLAIFIYYSESHWIDLMFYLVWFLFYILPLNLVFGLFISTLEVHRMQATHFKEKLIELRLEFLNKNFENKTDGNLYVNSSDSETHLKDTNCNGNNGIDLVCDDIAHLVVAVEEVTEQYLYLHDCFRHTSDECGVYLFTTFMLPMLIILSSIWSIYENFFSFASILGYIIMSLFYLLEIGLAVVAVNEAGNLVCRDISSFLIRFVIRNSSIQHRRLTQVALKNIDAFISCLAYIKLEIPFFGNFSLRSRTLMAIVASLIGAMIPGIVSNHM